MEKILNLQISLFGKFDEITPESDVSASLSKRFVINGMVPGTVENIILDQKKKTYTSEPRLKLASVDQSFSILIFKERLDFNYSISNTSQESNIERIVNKLIEYCKAVDGIIPFIKGHRVAVNSNLLLHFLPDSERDQFIERFLKKPSYYNGPLIEWNAHFNSITNISFGKSFVEQCNTITSISEIFEMDNLNKIRIRKPLLSIDINTNATNLEFKYGLLDLCDFAEKALPIMKSIIAFVGD